MLTLRVPTNQIIVDLEKDCLLYENTRGLLPVEKLTISFPSCISIGGSCVTLPARNPVADSCDIELMVKETRHDMSEDK
jgi:hypothetical protein